LSPSAQHLPGTIIEESHSDLLRLLDSMDLTATEVRLLHLLAQSSPHPVRVGDLAAAVTGCPSLNRRQRSVLEQQLTRLRSKLIAHNMRLLCVERYGYLLLRSSEE
jgi:DNA-binding response OmpR family regulator